MLRFIHYFAVLSHLSDFPRLHYASLQPVDELIFIGIQYTHARQNQAE